MIEPWDELAECFTNAAQVATLMPAVMGQRDRGVAAVSLLALFSHLSEALVVLEKLKIELEVHPGVFIWSNSSEVLANLPEASGGGTSGN